MTKQPSRPESKPISQTGDAKGEGKSAKPESAMGRFRALAKKVVTVGREEIAEQERRERSKKDGD
jgi:hypothetical protein